MAELTEMRITENNAPSPEILLIQGPRQEATVESAERRAPDQPRAGRLAQWPPGHVGPSQSVGSSAARRSGLGFWTPHACRLDGGLFVSVRLAGVEAASSQGSVWLPPLPGKGSSQLPTQLPLFLTSPFLMWQLSAYHSARCQGNHRAVGWAQNTACAQPRGPGRREAGGGRRGEDPGRLGSWGPGPSSR